MSVTYVIIVAFLGLVFSAVAKKIRFSSELFLVIVMGAISFLPFVPRTEIDGHHLLEIILPPLLFSAARNLSGYKFRKMKYPIVWMGVVLIFLTAFAVALVASAMIGFMTLSAGLILGAIVAPPDAVSSISIGKKLGLPDRVMTILTGESLINDAAALTLCTFAISLTFGETSFIEDPATLLLWTSVVGVLTGAAVGFLTLFVRKLINFSNIIAVFTALIPWAVYILAEHFHGSGVLASVVAGFIIERTTYRASHVTRLAEQSLWHSIETLLDAFVFAYIGLQIRFILEDLNNSALDNFWTFGAALIVLATVILVRPVGVLAYNLARLIWYKTQYKHIQHFVSSRDLGDKIQSKAHTNIRDAGVSWRQFLVLSWTGMRGVVTLAAAAAIPTQFSWQQDFDYHSDAFKIHIFIQVTGLTVAIGTLLIQGLTLPWVIQKLLGDTNDVSADPLAGQWKKARQIIDNSALEIIESESAADPDNFDKEHFMSVWKMLDSEAIGKNKRDISFVSTILSEIVEKQRADIQEAARKGDLHPDVAREFLDRLDLKLASYTSR